jgi:CRP-like cAMP-binding protein
MQHSSNNQIVRRLSQPDYAAIRTRLEPVELRARETLIRINYPVPHVYFVEFGQISMLAKVHDSDPIEVGMIGPEGMTDLVPSGRSPLEAVCQIGGTALRIDRQALLDLAQTSFDFSQLMMRHQSSMLAQVAFTALSHGAFSVEERLARWLLMIHDRIEGDEVSMSHEFYAWMLAVRRAGVTGAFKALKAEGAITSKRGIVTIINRDVLMEAASGSYGPAELEYERLLGQKLPPPLSPAHC